MSSDDHRPMHEIDALRLLVRNSTDMLARHAPDGTYLYVSPACGPLLGYEPDDLVGRSAYQFFHTDDLQTVAQSHERVLATPDLHTIQYRMLHADGGYVWIETTSRAVRDGAGDVVEIHTSSRDITRRREAQARLAESERRFRLSMANAPNGMALVGADGAWLAVNDRLCEIVDRSREELLELTFQDITHPDDLDTDLGHVAELLAGSRDRYSMEKRYLRPGGEVVWCLLSVSVVRDDHGEPIHFISQIQDISERKQREQELGELNERLAESNAELERFALVASHDLRSPLAAARGLLSLLPSVARDLPEGAARILERGLANLDRSLETVEALLQLARLGGTAPMPTVVDTRAVVADLEEVFAEDLAEADASLEVDGLPMVAADPAQVRLLLQNLIDNAIKNRHTDRGLRVRIAATPAAGSWRFTVDDNGRGFAREDRDVMFELFGRTAAGEQLEGSGIGLATCRRIIDQHGGEISAEPLDPGARFTFTLPAVADDA